MILSATISKEELLSKSSNLLSKLRIQNYYINPQGWKCEKKVAAYSPEFTVILQVLLQKKETLPIMKRSYLPKSLLKSPINHNSALVM